VTATVYLEDPTVVDNPVVDEATAWVTIDDFEDFDVTLNPPPASTEPGLYLVYLTYSLSQYPDVFVTEFFTELYVVD